MRAGGPLPLFITMNIIMIMNKNHNFAQQFTAAYTNRTVQGQSNNRYRAYNFVKRGEGVRI